MWIIVSLVLIAPKSVINIVGQAPKSPIEPTSPGKPTKPIMPILPKAPVLPVDEEDVNSSLLSVRTRTYNGNRLSIRRGYPYSVNGHLSVRIKRI